MALEVLYNKSDHTHENKQFARTVKIIEKSFEKLGYEGLLIGSPFNQSFSWFRADALLFYSDGLVIIDFKDYQGNIEFPSDEKEFLEKDWLNKNLNNNEKIIIKGGSGSKNPMKQLSRYREALKGIIKKNRILKNKINEKHICTLNVFSGPIHCINEVPGEHKPYYHIVDEKGVFDFLKHYTSENKYNSKPAEVLKTIFPGDEWIEGITIEDVLDYDYTEENYIELNGEIEEELQTFLGDENEKVMVLESINFEERDSWVHYILNEFTKYNIPQVETWCHSSRIGKKLWNRSRIESQGVYSAIYGGRQSLKEGDKSGNGQGDNEKNNELLEVVSLQSDIDIDEQALIVLHEAHLINRSLNQSDLLRFGSGRLLEDIIKFIGIENKRKLIIIGDPYSLSYGKTEDSALNLNTLEELGLKKIKFYKEDISKNASDEKEKLRLNIANSIEDKIFNNLNYNFEEESLVKLEKDTVADKLKEWFSESLESEPENGVLFYSKRDCYKTNLWIKKHCLKNGRNLAENDLIVANNNVLIPDETGFGVPKRIVNGMFFRVNKVLERQSFDISIKQANLPITLNFLKLSVVCLSLYDKPKVNIWILDNYFINENGLNKEEKIAFKVFINRRLNKFKQKERFIDSNFYKDLKESDDYYNLTSDEKNAVDILIKNYSLSKSKKERVKTTQAARKLLQKYNDKYTRNIFSVLRDKDPLINAIFIKYGWALTVHKALGTSYNEIILKGFRRENDGVNNEDYFRWLYSGLSTAQNKINLTSPQVISPFINCVFEDTSIITKTIIKKTSSKKTLVYKDYIPLKEYERILKPITNENVVAAICELSKRIKSLNYSLSRIDKNNDYNTKVIFKNSEEKKIDIRIDNKGKKKKWAVSNIQVDDSDPNLTKDLKSFIGELFQRKPNTKRENGENIDFPNDFRYSVYSQWKSNLKKINFKLNLAESHKNQDVFIVQNNKDKIRFRVWYGTSEKKHTKGFLSKIEVIEKTTNKYNSQFKNLLLNGYV